MEWFTLSPAALGRLREATSRLRRRLGSARVAERIRGMDDGEMHAFVADVLALLDESQAILGRTRPEAPARKPLPDPFAAIRG